MWVWFQNLTSEDYLLFVGRQDSKIRIETWPSPGLKASLVLLLLWRKIKTRSYVHDNLALGGKVYQSKKKKTHVHN